MSDAVGAGASGGASFSRRCLRWSSSLPPLSDDPDGYALYEGTGQYAADIDGCGLTPHRDDPGMSQGNEQLGGFRGDNFLGCTVSATVPEHDGRRYTSPPFPVSFCALAPVEVAGGRDLAFDAAESGRLVVPVSSRAWLDGADISATLRWRLEEMPAPTRLSPGEATGAEVALAYEGLPTRNRAFGEKTVTVRAEGGACACEREETVRVFYAPMAVTPPPATRARAPTARATPTGSTTGSRRASPGAWTSAASTTRQCSLL